MKRTLFAVGLFLDLGLMAGPTPQEVLSVDIVPPLNRDGNAEVFASDESYRALHVVLSNNSDLPLRVYEDWNSWGRDCLSFEAVTKQGRKVILKRFGQAYTKNFPSTFAIFPHGHYVLSVVLSTNQWESVALISDHESQPITLKAIYEFKKQETNTHAVWIGRVESPPRIVTVEH